MWTFIKNNKTALHIANIRLNFSKFESHSEQTDSKIDQNCMYRTKDAKPAYFRKNIFCRTRAGEEMRSIQNRSSIINMKLIKERLVYTKYKSNNNINANPNGMWWVGSFIQSLLLCINCSLYRNTPKMLILSGNRIVSFLQVNSMVIVLKMRVSIKWLYRNISIEWSKMASFEISLFTHSQRYRRLYFVRNKIILFSPFIHISFKNRVDNAPKKMLWNTNTNTTKRLTAKKNVWTKCKCAVKHNLHVSYSGNHLLCKFSLSIQYSFYCFSYHCLYFSFASLFFSICSSSLDAIYTWIDRTYPIRIGQKRKKNWAQTKSDEMRRENE